MKRLFAIAVLLMAIKSQAQSDFQPQKSYVDSIVDRICEQFQHRGAFHDSSDILYVIKAGFPERPDLTEEQQKLLNLAITIRLQHNCLNFYDLAIQYFAGKDASWQRTRVLPAKQISKTDLKAFHHLHRFYYYETENSKIQVDFSRDYWIGHFADGTYSKLKVHWVSADCFILEFLESNNLSQKLLSIPGDQYIYHLLTKGDHWFQFAVNIKGVERYEINYFHFQ